MARRKVTKKAARKAKAKARKSRKGKFDTVKAREKLRHLIFFGRAEKHPREHVHEHAELLIERCLREGDYNGVSIVGELIYAAFGEGVDAAARATGLLSEDELPPKARAS